MQAIGFSGVHPILFWSDRMPHRQTIRREWPLHMSALYNRSAWAIHPLFFCKGSARKTKACAAFSSSDRSSRGPSIQSKPAKNFSGRAIGASRSFRSGGGGANGQQFEKAKPT